MPQTALYKFGAIHMLCAQDLCVCTLKVLDTMESHHNTTEESKKDSYVTKLYTLQQQGLLAREVHDE